MKIALLTDGIHPYVIGGMQRHSYFLAKYLALSKISVDLYHTYLNKDFPKGDLSIFSEEALKYIHAYAIDFPILKKYPGHYIKESYVYSCQIFDLIKDKLEEYDFIYAKGFSAWKLIEEKKKGLSCPPIGVKFHGLNMFQKPPSFKGWIEQFLFRKPVRFNMLNADYVFSYGGKITSLTKKIGVKEDRIIEIPTGISNDWLAERISKNNSPRKFLFIGRYDKLKGLPELNQAIKQLLKEHLPFEFHFIGPIPEKVQIKDIHIKYWGTVNQDVELKKIIDQCDLLVCPSHSEGMPNVIIEAMARGLAVIATDVGAVNYLVSEKNGWLIHYGERLPKFRKLRKSPSTIYKAVLEAIHIDDKELNDMKQYSLSFTKEHLMWDGIIEKLIGEIKKIIKLKE